MAHKIAVEKIDWGGLADELESIGKPKNPKSNRVYVIGAAFIGILLLFTSLNIMILAQTPSGVPTVIEPGSMVEWYSYLIFVSGGTYYVRNGTTGAIDYSGTNASEVINYGIANAPSYGGSILIKSGYYHTLAPIIIQRSHLTIQGEIAGDPNSALLGGTHIRRAGNFDAIQILGTPTERRSLITISDLAIHAEGEAGTGSAIYMNYSGLMKFENLNIRGFYGGSALNVYSCYGFEMESSIITGCGNVAGGFSVIDFRGDTLAKNTGIQIENNIFEVPQYRAISIEMCGDIAYIRGNYFEGISGGLEPVNHIYDNGFGEGGGNVGATITGNIMAASTGAAILLGPYSEGAQIISNRIGSSDTWNIDALNGTRPMIANNEIVGGRNGVKLNDGIVTGNNVFYLEDVGVSVTGNGSQIIGNWIGWNGIDGAAVDRVGLLLNANHTLVESNLFWDFVGLPMQLYAIKETPTADYNQIIGNTINCTLGTILRTGTHTIIRMNGGYITENRGIANVTGAVSSVTVNHGLATTPTIVIVTVNNTGAGNYSVPSDLITSSQFVISFTNQPGTSEWLFYWYAEV